jgi:apolipoprotein N-acyltransferase
MLKPYQRSFLFLLSFLIVAFGQPVHSQWLSLLSACIGFALFFSILLKIAEKKHRFYLALIWYAAVQTVQLSWMASHPYAYIYAVIAFCATMMGVQFGLLALLIRPHLFSRWIYVLAAAGLWTIMEWSRLFFLSGLPFNPVGLTLTASLYPLQLASLGGIYLLSFWVILTNLMVLKGWVFKGRGWMAGLFCILFPYCFGVAHILLHTQPSSFITAVLIQPATPVEEAVSFKSAAEARQFVMEEWRHILSLIKEHLQAGTDFIVLPEYVVPYGTYHAVFAKQEVHNLFEKFFGAQSLAALPPLEEPYAMYLETHEGKQWLLSNAFFAQALANIFQADVVIGLEDSEYVENGAVESYSSAFHFAPYSPFANRYEKQVLVPMGEYIPFTCCRALAAQYGIQSSFTCGKGAKVFNGKIPFSPSICYEEAYGHLMRLGRKQGAQLLVNLTNDGWFPSSTLPQQHFDHARLRTVENGTPLIRACNTGITGAVDSLGRIVAVLGDGSAASQLQAGALRVEVPTYHYPTLYAQWGDYLMISLSGLLLLISLGFYIKDS